MAKNHDSTPEIPGISGIISASIIIKTMGYVNKSLLAAFYSFSLSDSRPEKNR
jgi:hypothetical protein